MEEGEEKSLRGAVGIFLTYEPLRLYQVSPTHSISMETPLLLVLFPSPHLLPLLFLSLFLSLRRTQDTPQLKLLVLPLFI